MKFYIQNMLIKESDPKDIDNDRSLVIDVDNPLSAVEFFIEEMFMENKTIAPLIVVSEAGFISDLYDFGMIDVIERSNTFSSYEIILKMANECEEGNECVKNQLLKLAEKIKKNTVGYIETLCQENINLKKAVQSLLVQSNF